MKPVDVAAVRGRRALALSKNKSLKHLPVALEVIETDVYDLILEVEALRAELEAIRREPRQERLFK